MKPITAWEHLGLGAIHTFGGLLALYAHNNYLLAWCTFWSVYHTIKLEKLTRDL